MRHDLRTRVGIGQGYVSMLMSHHDVMTPEQRASALQGLAEAFARLDAFGRRVLMDDRLEIGDVVPQRADVSVEALVGPARAAYPEVVVEVAPGAPGTAHVDPTLVREILDNLLANAHVAAPADSDVLLRVSGGEGTVRFEVTDEGGVVTEADRAVLFTRYGRTERSRRGGVPGLGLGLSIVRRLVEAHGGAYGAETGSVTTFWVELPVSPPGPATP